MIPGATAMQTAAYVGLVTRGAPGAAASFIGFGLPAFALMLVMAALYVQTHQLPVVTALFKGLAAMIVAIVANATWSFSEHSLRDLRRALIATAAAALFAWGIHPFLVITLAGLAGLMLTAPAQNTGSVVKDSHRAVILILGGTMAGFVALFLADRKLFELATLMFRIDLFAFGGGYASVPLMLHEVVNIRHWLDDATFMRGLVLGQVTPGPIVITATFLLVVAITPCFNKLRASPLFNKIIAGALCSFVGLLLNVAIHFATQIDWDVIRTVLAVAAFAALRLKVDIFWVALAVAIVSVLLLR
jgi:chromate transporter